MANHLSRLVILARLFFFSPWAARLLLFIGIPGAVSLITGKVIDCGDWEPLFVVGGSALAIGSIVIYMAVVLLIFPVQLISIISSRQYGLITNLRHYLAVLIICVLLLLQIVAYCVLKFGIKSDNVVHFSLIVAIMLMVGLVMLALIRVGSIQIFYFFALPTLAWYLVPQLKIMADLTLVAILVSVWIAFLGWWFNWHPKKYYKNLSVMYTSELSKQDLSFWGEKYFGGAAPQDLASGILFGKFGNTFFQVRMFIAALLVTGVILILAFILSSSDIKNALMTGIRIGIAIQIIQIGYNYSLAVFKNIHNFWLYFSFERIQLFTAVEQQVAVFYLKNLAAITFVISALSVVILEDYLPLKNVALYALASLLVAAISLYMVFIVYAKWRGNLNVFHWVNGITMILLLGACFLGLEFFAQQDITIYAGYLLTITVVGSSLIFIMRQYAKRLWQQVDLVRVVS